MAYLKNGERRHNLLVTLVCRGCEVGALIKELEFGGGLALIHGHDDVQKAPISAIFQLH